MAGTSRTCSGSLIEVLCLHLPLLLHKPFARYRKAFTDADSWLVPSHALESIAIQGTCNSGKTNSLPCDGWLALSTSPSPRGPFNDRCPKQSNPRRDDFDIFQRAISISIGLPVKQEVPEENALVVRDVEALAVDTFALLWHRLAISIVECLRSEDVRIDKTQHVHEVAFVGA